jgi:glycosyltransferase involved in cell wall biosynthesis
VPNGALPLYQAASDILIMPYQDAIAGSSGGDTARFASPMKAFEYMASGRPILSSDLPVFREVLDETFAILLPAGDLKAWDEALKGLLGDEARRRRMGREATEVAKGYSWVARAEKILVGTADE